MNDKTKVGERIGAFRFRADERGELQASRRSDELVLQVGAWRRTLLLPRALIDSPTKGAKMDDGTLRIQFEAPAKAGARGGRK